MIAYKASHGFSPLWPRLRSICQSSLLIHLSQNLLTSKICVPFSYALELHTNYNFHGMLRHSVEMPHNLIFAMLHTIEPYLLATSAGVLVLVPEFVFLSNFITCCVAKKLQVVIWGTKAAFGQ